MTDASLPDASPIEPAVAPTGLRLWWEAARPRTLPASIVPVLVGTAASDAAAWTFGGNGRVADAFGKTTADAIASAAPRLNWLAFALAMVVALALQIAVNFANDYFDGVKGVDTAARVGPRRVTAEGLVTHGQMKLAIGAALALAGVAGLSLALLVDPRLLLVGAASGLAALGYSGGPKPYASAGLGEVFVFVFFGLVATLGSQYVQDERLSSIGWVCAVAVGLWSVALLLVNNLRDIPTDREVGKRTLAVRVGEDWTRGFYLSCLMIAYALVLALIPLAGEGWLGLPLLSLLVVGPAFRIVSKAPIGPVMIEALGRTAKAQLVFGVLLTIGLATRSPEVLKLVEQVG